MGIADNTLVIFTSDNGASQEGLCDGRLNTDRYRNYFPDTVEEMITPLTIVLGYCNLSSRREGTISAASAVFKRGKNTQVVGPGTLLEARYPRPDVFAGAQFASGRPMVDLVARRGAAPGLWRAASMLWHG